jgi:hypothetical protein
MEDPKESLEKEVLDHIPHVFALRQPTLDTCEMIITTKARTSHVFHLTYTQIRLLASQAEKARINWPQESKIVKADKDKS